MSDELVEPDDAELERFWTAIRPPGFAAARPEAWAFGATASQADELLALVLAGIKTATAGAMWDYEVEGEPLPTEGMLNILLDGAGKPRALARTTSVHVVAFDKVDAEHAWLEGENDRSLPDWRTVHERFFTDHASHGRGFATDMPVVLERFELLHPLSTRPLKRDWNANTTEAHRDGTASQT